MQLADNQIEEIVPFFTKIHIFKLKHFDVDKVTQYINNVRTLDSGVKISNHGGWQSHPLDSAVEDMTSIVDEIILKLKPIYASMGIRTEPKMGGYWMNINHKHCTNTSHNHAGSYYSACLYVRTPDNSGNIVFERDDKLSDYHYDTDLTENNYVTFSIKPSVGEVIIFPAWLKHYVETNLTTDEDDRRISMAFKFR